MAGPQNLKERRDNLKKATEELEAELHKKLEFEKSSQLRVLKAACQWFKKEAKFGLIHERQLKSANAGHSLIDNIFCSYSNINLLDGFIVCFEKMRCSNRKKGVFVAGELIYISENAQDYFQWNSLDIMLTYDTIQEITSPADTDYFNSLFSDPEKYMYPNTLSSYTSWFVSRIKRKSILSSDYLRFKMTCHYDPTIEAFIGLCQPVLSPMNREMLVETDSRCFSTVHGMDLKLVQMKGILTDLLMVDSCWREDANNTSLYQIVSSESLELVVKRHEEILNGKTGRGSTDLIKLLTKDGDSINCLCNMYIESKQLICCAFQIMSEEDAINYEKKGWKMDTSDLVQSPNEFDISEYWEENLGSVDADETLAVSRKRHSPNSSMNSSLYFDEDSQTDYAGFEKKAKFSTTQDDENNNSSMGLLDLNKINIDEFYNENYTPSDDLSDMFNIDMIKTALKQECFDLATTGDNEKCDEKDFLGYTAIDNEYLVGEDNFCWEDYAIDDVLQTSRAIVEKFSMKSLILQS